MQSQGISSPMQFWKAPRRRDTARELEREEAAPAERAGGEARLDLPSIFLGAFPRAQKQIVIGTLAASALYLAFAVGFFMRYLAAGSWVIDYTRYPAEARLFTSAVGGAGLLLALVWGVVAGSVLALRKR